MEDYTWNDRRIFERFKINLPLVCVPEQSPDQTEVNAFDISAQGLGFVSETDFKPGAEMNFTLRIPALNKEFATRGTVVWTRKYYNRFRAGIRLDPACVMGVSTVLRMLRSLPV